MVAPTWSSSSIARGASFRRPGTADHGAAMASCRASAGAGATRPVEPGMMEPPEPAATPLEPDSAKPAAEFDFEWESFNPGATQDAAAARQDQIAFEAELGVGETPFGETFFEAEYESAPSDMQPFAAALGAEWSKRRNGDPSPNAMTAWLLKDYQATLDGARRRWGKKFGAGQFTVEALGRAWKVSRTENMKFQGGSPGAKVLGKFDPPAENVALVTSTLIEDSDKAPVAPLLVKFVEELRRRYSGFVRASNYPRHGGGKFNNRGHSLDLFIKGLDDRGFYPKDGAVKLLRAVHEAASAVGAQWRVIYNDFEVADVVNRALGRQHVIFVGSTRKTGNTVTGLNWHGPAPLILHFHLDLAPLAGGSPSSWKGVSGSVSSSGSSSAMQANRRYSQTLGWGQYQSQIEQFLGFTNMSPSEGLFADAIRQWQQTQGLGADGTLGPKTWAKMKPYVLGNPSSGTSGGGGISISKAVEANRRYAQSLGWGQYQDKIELLLGFTNMSPTEELFAEAVGQWQQAQGLGADGTLGPKTWAKMSQQLGLAAPNPSGSLMPPTDPSAYRRFRLTSYHVVDQRDVPTGAVRVPIYDDQGRKLAEGSPAFFAQLSLEGTGRLDDGRLIKVTSGKVRVLHDDYAEVLAYHLDNVRGKPPGYSGIVVENDRVVQALAFHEVPANKRGIGYGVQRGIPFVPFRTLAADIGRTMKSEPLWKGKGGVVPPGMHVYIKEYDGLRLPDGTRHDGWFVVNDTGGGIFGVHFDVFTGTRALRKQVRLPAVGTVWFPGIEQRIPPGYDYGLKA